MEHESSQHQLDESDQRNYWRRRNPSCNGSNDECPHPFLPAQSESFRILTEKSMCFKNTDLGAGVWVRSPAFRQPLGGPAPKQPEGGTPNRILKHALTKTTVSGGIPPSDGKGFRVYHAVA